MLPEEYKKKGFKKKKKIIHKKQPDICEECFKPEKEHYCDKPFKPLT